MIKKITAQPEREPAAEMRMQSLLREMEKLDETPDGDDSGETMPDVGYSVPRGRWPDESTDKD